MTDDPAHAFLEALDRALTTGEVVEVTEATAADLADIGAALVLDGYSFDPTADDRVVITAPDGRSFTFQRT